MFDVAVSGICRDEHCEIVGLHGEHKVRAYKEQPCCLREPPEALDDSIVRAVNHLRVSCFRTIMIEVENDFGSLGPTEASGTRRLHRRIAQLVYDGQIDRIRVDNQRYVYVSPTMHSRDLGDLRDALDEMMDYESYDKPPRHRRWERQPEGAWRV